MSNAIDMESVRLEMWKMATPEQRMEMFSGYIKAITPFLLEREMAFDKFGRDPHRWSAPVKTYIHKSEALEENLGNSNTIEYSSTLSVRYMIKGGFPRPYFVLPQIL